jgi:hypothetical protein
MAVPSAVAKSTVTAVLLGLLSVTVNVNSVVPTFPSFKLTLLIDRVAKSSFRIVPVPVPASIVAPLALESVTVNVSSGSTFVSPLTTNTVIDLLVSPGANVSVPLVAR